MSAGFTVFADPLAPRWRWVCSGRSEGARERLIRRLPATPGMAPAPAPVVAEITRPAPGPEAPVARLLPGREARPGRPPEGRPAPGERQAPEGAEARELRRPSSRLRRAPTG